MRAVVVIAEIVELGTCYYTSNQIAFPSSLSLSHTHTYVRILQYENDGEADEDDADNEEPPFGEDLYIDEEDRQELEKKPELEREMILTERAERRQTWLDSKRLREEARNRKAREAAAVAAVKPAAGSGKKKTRRKGVPVK